LHTHIAGCVKIAGTHFPTQLQGSIARKSVAKRHSRQSRLQTPSPGNAKHAGRCSRQAKRGHPLRSVLTNADRNSRPHARGATGQCPSRGGCWLTSIAAPIASTVRWPQEPGPRQRKRRKKKRSSGVVNFVPRYFFGARAQASKR